MRLSLLAAAIVSAAGCRAPAATTVSEVVVSTTPSRKGVEARPAHLATAPKDGLLLTSNGLVNETFRIAADFDAKTLSRETTYARDGSKQVESRALTGAEIESLRADRARVWSAWTAPAENPAAEYREDLVLLDGDAATAITAEGGFHEEHSGDTPDAIALARRLDAMTRRY